MSDRSAIEWTDATWNPVRGCTTVSPGCKFCYAELFAERFRGVPGHPFEQGFDFGVSVENRQYGLPRIRSLQDKPARIRFLSVEPLLADLGPLDLAESTG